MKNIFQVFLALAYLSSMVKAQSHGVSPAWGTEITLPKSPNTSASKGAVGTNMVFTSRGKIVLSYVESPTNNANVQRLYYLTSDDGGKTWSLPAQFRPAWMSGIVGACCTNLAIDDQDNIHAVWYAKQPLAVFYSKFDTAMNVIIDTVRVSAGVRHKIESNIISVDKKNRVHITWHDGDPEISTQPAEVVYNRSSDGGKTFEQARLVSADDNKHSAFARFDFSGTANDTLCIAWRDSVGGNNAWDVVGSTSTNGGKTWSAPFTIATGSGKQWDPGVVVDKHGIFHVNFHNYPAGSQLDAVVYYVRSLDGGKSWLPSTTYPNFTQLSLNDATGKSIRSELTTFNYDFRNDVQWVFWKDERDFSMGNGKADIMASYSRDKGITWSTGEFITDWGDQSVGLKGSYPAPDGSVALNYDVFSSSGVGTMYFRRRSSVLTSVALRSDTQQVMQINPQPAAETFTVSAPHGEQGELRLVSPLGQIVYRWVLSGQQTLARPAGLASGIYLAEWCSITQPEKLYSTLIIFL